MLKTTSNVSVDFEFKKKNKIIQGLRKFHEFYI